jgi:hypothetical protein
MKRNVLLLTSTIKPRPNQPQLSVIDPEARLRDYESALEFYSHQLEKGRVDRIVFVDNSGFDLRCLSDRFQSQDIEWISFYGLDYPHTYHRGYGEFRLIDYAFSHSVFLRDLSDTDVVWKVTGRYIVRNLGSVIRLAPRNFDFYCDIKNNWVGMEIMAWNRAGYEALIKGVWQKFAGEMAPELILSDTIKSISTRMKNISTTYFWPPYIEGRRGSDGGKFIGRFTPIRFGLVIFSKLALLPFRYLSGLKV